MPEEQKPFTELVYAGKDVEDLVRAQYPDAVITDESDYIHTDRFGCVIPNITRDDFYPFAILNGFVRECLGFQLVLKTPFLGRPDVEAKSKEDLSRWLASAKKMKEDQNGGQDETPP